MPTYEELRKSERNKNRQKKKQQKHVVTTKDLGKSTSGAFDFISVPSAGPAYHDRPTQYPTPRPVFPKRKLSVEAVNSRPTKKGKKKHEYGSQRASVELEQFLNEMPRIQKYVLESETDERTGQPCPCNRDGAICDTRCDDCLFYTPTCTKCFVSAHSKCPLHWAEVWNGRYYERKDISELEHVITFGHHGDSCPHFDKKHTRTFDIVHTNGIHHSKVFFCNCPRMLVMRELEDLLASRIMPATVEHPETGFTFAFLRDFHLETLTSKKSAYDYMHAARRRTNNAFPKTVPLPMKQMSRVSRIWRSLALLKRSGMLHNVNQITDASPYFPCRETDNILPTCFTCPEPGFNVSMEQFSRSEIPAEFQHLFRVFLSQDGHFGHPRKSKVDDPDDISLIHKLGAKLLFPPDDRMNEYLGKPTVKTSEEKSESKCSKFNSIDLQNKLKFKGCVISGVVGLQCARHNVFLSMVDLTLGESYAHVDMALARGLETKIAEVLRQSNHLYDLVLLYDVACQYHKNLRKRFQEHFPHLNDVIQNITCLVPKLHLNGHKDDCQFRYSLNYTECCGRVDGEGIERSWSGEKQTGGSTKEMNHGHRHDVLTDFYSDNNWLKVQGTVRSLSEHLINARKEREKKVSYFLHLSQEAGRENVECWEKMPTEPRLDPRTKQWQSVYRYSQKLIPTQAEVLKRLTSTSENRAVDSELRAQGPIAQLINDAFKLQARQRALRALVDAQETPPAEIDKDRSKLHADIRTWQRRWISPFPAIRPLITGAPFVEAEDETLFLPSDIQQSRWSELTLEAAASLEAELRGGEAVDAITDIRHSIRHTIVSVDTKRKLAKGVKMSLRSSKYIRDIKSKQDAWARKYRYARECILTLDGSTASQRKYPPLHDEDMFAKNVLQPGSLGDGTKDASWIWTWETIQTETEAERTAYELENDRVNWFRARANALRWIEEEELLDEEFRRFIRASRRMSDIWQHLAVAQSLPGHKAYAFEKSDMFRDMATDAETVFNSSKICGKWPENESIEALLSHVRSQRPSLRVEWEKSGVDELNLCALDDSGNVSDDSADDIDINGFIIEK